MWIWYFTWLKLFLSYSPHWQFWRDSSTLQGMLIKILVGSAGLNYKKHLIWTDANFRTDNIFCLLLWYFSSSGRKHVARVLCLLRNIRARLKTCGNGGLDIATAAMTTIASSENVDTLGTRLTNENEDVGASTAISTQPSSIGTATSKSGNSATSNITPGTSLLQQRNLNERGVIASMAKTAGEMLTRR